MLMEVRALLQKFVLILVIALSVSHISRANEYELNLALILGQAAVFSKVVQQNIRV
jgi:hypothetical protein